MTSATHTVILHYARRAAKAVAIKAGVCLAFALMIFVPGQSLGQQASLVPCRDQLKMYQQDKVTPGLAQAAANWFCPDPNARVMPTQKPANQASSGGGFPMGLPTTEGQSMVTVFGWLLQGVMSGGSSADEQQQQALLQQKQAEEKLKAEMLQRERAAQASEARSLWESQDAARNQELENLFGLPTEKTGGMSSLLQKQAALQLRAVAAPNSSASDESLRHRSGEGFDQAGKTLATVPDVPEPEGILDPALVMSKVKESRAWIDKLDRELEATRKKHEKAQHELEQARQELTAQQAKPGPEAQQDDAALLAALEAEEQNIKTLSREMEESSAQLKVLDDQRHKAVQELETWSGKLKATQQH
jgi:hypothetical protein